MAAYVAGACAQSAGHAASTPGRMGVAAATVEPALGSSTDVLREIEDPSTGDLWLLLRDQSRSGGPGRFVLARQRTHTTQTSGHCAAQPISAIERPVIHAADAVIVEEHTAVVDTRLEAVALGPAAKGAQFKARLKIGGKAVRAVAISPGRAEFAPQSEVGP